MNALIKDVYYYVTSLPVTEVTKNYLTLLLVLEYLASQTDKIKPEKNQLILPGWQAYFNHVELADGVYALKGTRRRKPESHSYPTS